MYIRGFILTAMLVMLNTPFYCQQGFSGKSLEEYIEYLVSIGFDELEAIDFSEEISSLKDNPVDINNASEHELGKLFFLSPFQVKSIINYIRSQGPLQSYYELAYIPGFDKELAKLSSEYVILRKRPKGISNSISTKLSTSIIYSDRDSSSYPGSPIKFTQRISHQAGRVSLGLVLDKDSGERMFYKEYRPEFLSGYIKLSMPNPATTFIIGDFRVRFGQGLSVWHGYYPGASPLSANIVRGSSRTMPHTSTDENNFFRGLALSTALKKTKIKAYISANKIDATGRVLPDSSMSILSFYESGIHNTINGESKRDILTEYSAGINVNRNFNNFYLGCSVTGTMFSLPVIPENETESLYDFRGKHNLVFSIDYAGSIGRIYVYGEGAVNRNGRLALIQGFRLIPVERVKLNFLYGYTDRSFISFHGQIFGKETVNNFRSSLLANIEIDLAPNISLCSGMMSHSDLWYAYQSSIFPKSLQYMTEISWTPSDRIRVKLSHRSKESVSDSSIDRGIEISTTKSRSSSRLHLDLLPSEKLKLSSRMELSSSSNNSTKGYLAYLGARLDMGIIPISLLTRVCTFNIEDYENRIYTWEDDLLYHPSVPAMYGSGKRNYYILDYHPGNNLVLRLKYGYTQFNRKDQVFSFNEIRLQLRIRLLD